MDVAVRGLLSRSSELLRGTASLGSDENPAALEVIARALLENLITVLWVQVDTAHPDHLKAAAVAELARMARLNLRGGKARIVNRETGEDATAEFLASDRFKNLPRRMSVEDRAKQAGVEDPYNIFYLHDALCPMVEHAPLTIDTLDRDQCIVTLFLHLQSRADCEPKSIEAAFEF